MGHPPLTYVGEKKHLDRNQILLAKKAGELDMEEANNSVQHSGSGFLLGPLFRSNLRLFYA